MEGTATEGTTGTKETTPASAILETMAAHLVTIATLEETIATLVIHATTVIIVNMIATTVHLTTTRVDTPPNGTTGTIVLTMEGAGTMVGTVRMDLQPVLTLSWDHPLPFPHHQGMLLRQTDSCS